MIRELHNLYRKEEFNPGVVGIFTNPFYFVRKGLYDGIRKESVALEGILLDFGCGRKPYKELFPVSQYVGVDHMGEGHDHTDEPIDVYYDGTTLPFSEQTFDSVFSSEVLEHLFNLDEILDEINRVLKPKGRLLITVPFVWDEHEIPHDFARYTSFGLIHLLTEHGFKVISLEKTTTYVEAVVQMWNAYVAQTILPRNRFLKVALTPILISPITLIGMLLSRILPANKDFYCNSVLLAERL